MKESTCDFPHTKYRLSGKLLHKCFPAAMGTQTRVSALGTNALLRGAAILGILCALGGCASAPIPTEQFAVSQAAIESATTAGATEYAPVEIKTARDKLAAAKQAVTDEDYPTAAALAEEASVDAKLALAKAQSEKAKKSAKDIQDNLRTLLDEINRNTQQQMQSQPKS